MLVFINRQIKQIRQRSTLLFRKKKLLHVKIAKIPIYIFAITVVLIIRLLKPWFLVRLEYIRSNRIGHFVANSEMYLCEQDAKINVPNQHYIDVFFMDKLICNQQLATMLKRVLRIWPASIVAPIYRINRLIPGGQVHEIGENSMYDRDVHNLLDRFPPHLQFTFDEESAGIVGLRAIGIPDGAKFVCLNVRDSAYHSGGGWAYHNYRDSDIQNYVLAAEKLAEYGYFVIRMGSKVHSSISSSHPKVIDYATNGMRSDFMDIYLGAKCEFCISTGSGWDAVPENFRRPVVFVNFVPLESMHTYRSVLLAITKRHVWTISQKELSFQEIFDTGVGSGYFTSVYESKGVQLIENTPEEIRDVSFEMAERLAGSWQAHSGDEALNQRFWEIFPTDCLYVNGKRLHGQIRSRIGAVFLRNNSHLL